MDFLPAALSTMFGWIQCLDLYDNFSKGLQSLLSLHQSDYLELLQYKLLTGNVILLDRHTKSHKDLTESYI